MGKVVNIAAIGVGVFMARKHLPNMAANPAIRIHTLCDLDEALLDKRAEEFSPLRTTTNADTVFDDPDIDAVVVGTRGREHARFVIQAAQHGKHIYVEKPMTHTLDETRAVLEAVSGADIQVGVGFNRRYAPIMKAAKARFHGYKSGPANLLYRIVDDHRIRPEYVFDLADGGGHLLAEGCHIFDLIAWFLEAEPVEVYAVGPLETDNAVILTLSDESTAVLLCGGKGGLCYPKECMEVFCDHRTLVMDSLFEMRFDGPGENFLRTYPPRPARGPALEQDNMTGFYRARFAARPAEDLTGPHAANHLPFPATDHGHDRAIRAFAEAVVSGAPYGMSAIDGARATVCALKAYESIRTRAPVAIRPEEYGLKA